MWMLDSPFNQGEKFATSIKTSSDVERGGTTDWFFQEETPLRTETIPKSAKVAMNCPL
jgi:hypothetical protein